MNEVYRGQSLSIFFPPLYNVLRVLEDISNSTVVCKARILGTNDVATEIASDNNVIQNSSKCSVRAQFSAATTRLFVLGAQYEYDAIATRQDGSVLPLGKGSFVVKELVSVD